MLSWFKSQYITATSLHRPSSKLRLRLWYILAMEVARQLEKSPSSHYGGWLHKKFTISAAAVILVAAIFGGTIGTGRRLGNFTSPDAKNSYRVADEIEKDYNE